MLGHEGMQRNDACFIQGFIRLPSDPFLTSNTAWNTIAGRSGEHRIANYGTLKHLCKACNDALSTAGVYRIEGTTGITLICIRNAHKNKASFLTPPLPRYFVTPDKYRVHLFLLN